MVLLQRNYNFPRIQHISWGTTFTGGPTFSSGVGGFQLLISIETHITCYFPGGGEVRTPYPPLDPHMLMQMVHPA